MKFQNPPDEEIKILLKRIRTIAVVGLSPRPHRPSHRVASALQRFGYRIIPVRPAVEEVLGERAYPSPHELPMKPDVVDVFRAPEYVSAIVDDCIALRMPALWLRCTAVVAWKVGHARFIYRHTSGTIVACRFLSRRCTEPVTISSSSMPSAIASRLPLKKSAASPIVTPASVAIRYWWWNGRRGPGPIFATASITPTARRSSNAAMARAVSCVSCV